MVKSRSVKRNAKNARGLGRDIFLAATAPFPKSRPSYFRFARFNTSALCYLRAWHRLGKSENRKVTDIVSFVLTMLWVRFVVSSVNVCFPLWRCLGENITTLFTISDF